MVDPYACKIIDMPHLLNKNVLLGVTGGIAAYKAAELCRLLIKQGANLRVVMTPSATEFIGPLTFQALSGYPVVTEMFETHADNAMDHIDLARWTDLMLIAPATAGSIAKLADGYADNLLLTIAQKMGVETESFADSSGVISEVLA